jgi:hypothetical protein
MLEGDNNPAVIVYPYLTDASFECPPGFILQPVECSLNMSCGDLNCPRHTVWRDSIGGFEKCSGDIMTTLPIRKCKPALRIMDSIFNDPPKQITNDADIAPLDPLLIQKWHEVGPLKVVQAGVYFVVFESKNVSQFYGPRVIEK